MILNYEEGTIFNLSDESYIKTENRGRPVTCKHCGNKFKFSSEQEKTTWMEKKLPCPECKVTYCCIPPTEKQLRELQDIYFENGKQFIHLTPLVQVLLTYCRSLILKSYSNKILYEGQLEYYTNDAVAYLIEDYLANPKFKITLSFGGYLNFKIRQAIFGKHTYTVGHETLDYIFQDGHNVSYEDPKFNYVQIKEDKQIIIDAYKKVLTTVFNDTGNCRSSRDNYIRLFNINQFLIGGEKYVDMFYTTYEKRTKFIVLESLDRIKKELSQGCITKDY